MLKLFIKIQKFKLNNICLLFILISFNTFALKTDKQAEFVLEGDNFKNLPQLKDGMTQIKFWGNVSIQQGTLKIASDTAIIFNDKEGANKVILTGKQVEMEQFIDAEFGKINITADKINFAIKDDLLIMTGNVIIKSKIQGEMSGEKITMNLKTKEIKGAKSKNNRVKLTIKPKSK